MYIVTWLSSQKYATKEEAEARAIENASHEGGSEYVVAEIISAFKSEPLPVVTVDVKELEIQHLAIESKV